MKKLNLFLLLTVLALQTLGQSEHLLFNINISSSTDVKELQPIQDLANTFDNFEITKAFPAARSKQLESVFQITCDCSLQEVISELKKNSRLFDEIEYVPAFDLLDNLPNDYTITFTTDYALDLINAPLAWDITNGSGDIIIGISDSNFDLDHEEFSDKLSFVQAHMYNPNITHGTAVASIAAGATNNSKGKSAIGYNSKMSFHDMSFNSLLIARDQGVKILNLSWASSCFFISHHQNVINELIESGVIIVAAAGNGGTCGDPKNLVYPAAYEGVIAVSSIGPNYNHERTIGNSATTHQHNESVDLCAPGYDVALALPHNTYGYSSGTSFAAPFVSGTLALMLSENEQLNHCEAEYLLKSTALNIDSLNQAYAGQLGAGALDAHKAVLKSSSFQNTSINFVFNEEFGITHQLALDVSSDAPISHFDYWLVDTYPSTNGDWINEYDVHITYQTGCVFKTSVKEDVIDLQDTIIVLPVEGLALTAELANNSGELNWTTQSESNSYYFEVQKSTTGVEWTTIGNVEAAGFSNSQQTYRFEDRNLSNGVQYYRLNQVDFNGSSELSEVVSLKYNNSISTVFPNPASNNVTIENSEKILSLTIVDYQGKVQSQFHPLNVSTTIKVDHLSDGLYHLIIQTENGTNESLKLVIQQ